jgi:hypothetical protein
MAYLSEREEGVVPSVKWEGWETRRQKAEWYCSEPAE